MLEIELFWRLNCVLMLNWIIWNKTVWHLTLCIAQSAGAVEYTDCTSAEGQDPPNECPGYDTKQSDGGALGNTELPFIAIASRSTLARSGSTG